MSIVRPKILMLFLDGVGIGSRNGECNPFFMAELPVLRSLLDDRLPHLSQRQIRTSNATLVPLNATLGVEGLPQSGTGQTTLFTGTNAARFIGKHFGPYPYSSLRPLIDRENIFRKLTEQGRRVYYANAYPQLFLDHLSTHPTRTTATVMAWRSLGRPLNGLLELSNESAISADITNDRWVSLAFGDVPTISPRAAGHRLVSILDGFDFVVYEYFFTDHAGHSQSMDRGVEVLQMLDEFLGGIIESMDRNRMLVLLTSDHGNLEDLSTKKHTRNPVPLLSVGIHREKLVSRCTGLSHVTPAILNLLS